MTQWNMNDQDSAVYVLARYENSIMHIKVLLLQIQFTQECLYKYRTVQYTLGEKDREKFIFSTDLNWHCESSKNVLNNFCEQIDMHYNSI